MTNVISSLDLLKSYRQIVEDADELDTNSEVDFNEPEIEQTPVQELAAYIEDFPDESVDAGTIIEKFLKEKNYSIVPINGLINQQGNI